MNLMSRVRERLDAPIRAKAIDEWKDEVESAVFAVNINYVIQRMSGHPDPMHSPAVCEQYDNLQHIIAARPPGAPRPIIEEVQPA